MTIDVKSIGSLIDELCTTNIKCFMAQDRVMESKDEQSIVTAALDAQKLNARRCKLIAAIDNRLGEGNISPTAKTY